MNVFGRETAISATTEAPFELAPVGRARRGGSRARYLPWSRRHSRALVASGRFVGVLVPVLVLSVHRSSAVGIGLGGGIAVALLWFGALQKAAEAPGFVVGSTIRTAVGVVTGFAAVSAMTLWLPAVDFGTAHLLEMAGAIFLLTIAWERFAARTLGRTQLLVVGTGEAASNLSDDLRNESRRMFDVVGFVKDPPEVANDTAVGRVLGEASDLVYLVERHRPDIVVLATDDHVHSVERLLDVPESDFRVVSLVHFYEHAFGRVPLQHVTPTWFWSIMHLYQRPYPHVAKRIFDIVGACTALLLTTPLWPIVALLIRTSPGPIIFRQTRLGARGQPFTILKFRTMREDAEPVGQAVWAQHEDPRATRIGRCLRMTRLDELPQLWNVLKGEMSLVGPRPERPEFDDLLRETVPFWDRRQLVKPGVTGWAQVHRGYAGDCASSAEKLSYDLWYLRHRTIVIDLAICAKTVSTLLFPQGVR